MLTGGDCGIVRRRGLELDIKAEVATASHGQHQIGNTGDHALLFQLHRHKYVPVTAVGDVINQVGYVWHADSQLCHQRSLLLPFTVD
ncbi:hypothetical protein D3C84_1086920 [compost metagenome]